ncbi:MAG: hypothetical protein M1831_002816 [Alyxoria varia]|nr:MAG: hypothetical protein M1831_002816 [Alyxoria varia]
MAQESVLRVTKEIANIQKGSDLSLAVAFRDDNVRRVRAIIIGPPDTPYEFGFFEFLVVFSKEYPHKAPSVTCLTTNSGKIRFNPNIYADGKICLSILGTWRGEPGEEWSTVQGLESILLSIQSLMSPNPWENEPGFESCRRDSDKKDARMYAAKIRHETLRISVITRLEDLLGVTGPLRKEEESKPKFDEPLYNDEEPYLPFADLCKRRFLWYYQPYLDSIDQAIKEHGDDIKDNTAFPMTPFEGGSNGMQGTFTYSQIRERLHKIHNAINSETDEMELIGLRETDTPDGLAFSNRFERFSKELTSNSDSPVDFEMINKNPFAWRLVLFGKPMTNLDGGVFNIKIVWSSLFPDVQPRVKVETPLFHQRVSPYGHLCYIPAHADEPRSHISAIINAIEEESPPYDPRTTVNPEAANLLWGKPEDKKTYNRKLRKSAQESTEF